MGRFTGKQTVIIGGTQGMGLATARALAAEGAGVLITGRDETRLQQAEQRLGSGVRALRADLADLRDLETLAATVAQRLRSFDALFLFAALAEFAPLAEVSEASFDRQFAANARGAFFALQRLAPLVRDGGSITTVTVTPATASPGMSVYMGSKAALRAFTQGLAAELLGRRVRVNALAPGFIDTPSLGVAGLTAEERQALAALGEEATPMKRHGSVEEIARAALFLAFEATFTTGIELPVDGGLSTVDSPR